MSRFIVEKSQPLKGVVRISGSKNSVLPILAGALLTKEKCQINDVPYLSDVSVIQKIIEDFGVTTHWDVMNEIFTVEAKDITKHEASYDLVSKIRASFLIVGPLLARLGKVKIPFPGGCPIGSRPVELHLKGLAALGAQIKQDGGFIEIKASKLVGTNIYLDFPSVGATENIMMAAVLAEGQTTIQNCAVEPEIVDLANFLVSMGANIKGTGTDTIRITGVTELGSTNYTIIPDRIEAGTFMVAAAITEGDVIIENVVVDHLKPIIAKLTEANVLIEELDNGLKVQSKGDIMPIDIKTLPYSGFPTDMQAQLMSMLTVAKGTSIVIETVFENRFMHASELKKMGADIVVDGRTAVIEGVNKLAGTKVKATDLRAGAGLVLAGLIAKGETEVYDIFHIDRGYYMFDEKLQKLGAKIKRIAETN